MKDSLNITDNSKKIQNMSQEESEDLINFNHNKSGMSENIEFQIEEITTPEGTKREQINENSTSFDQTTKSTSREEGPIRLIEFDKKGFILNESALKMLRSIKEDVVVVSIVGKARTGKSYLMNLLLGGKGNKDNGFKVASTINSCTRGIWLWSAPRQKPNSNSKIIFIDSEGTNSVDLSTKTYDSKIFALVVLISSLFIYNTNGNIDETSIGDLALAAHLSTSIATSAKYDKDTMITELSPKFIWVLRDFTLDKVDPSTGEEISDNEYLEMCLKNKISGKNSQDNNLIRENILKYFKERECVSLPRPVDSEEDLQKLSTIPFNELKPSFRNEFLKLKSKVYQESKEKRVNKMKINGEKLAELLVGFVGAINSGCVPNICNVWDDIIQKEIEKQYEKSAEYFKDEISKFLCKNSNLTTSEVLRQFYKIKYEVLTKYDEVRQLNIEIYTNEAYDKIYQEFKSKLETEINKRINKEYQDELASRNQSIKKKIELSSKVLDYKMFNEQYQGSDKYKCLVEDFLSLIGKFKENVQKEETTEIRNLINKSDLGYTRDILYYIASHNKTELMKKEAELESEVRKNEIELGSHNINKLNDINKKYQKIMTALRSDLSGKEKEAEQLRKRLQELEQTRAEIKGKVQNELRKSMRKYKNVRISGDNYVLSQMKIEGNDEKQCECTQLSCNLF